MDHIHKILLCVFYIYYRLFLKLGSRANLFNNSFSLKKEGKYVYDCVKGK